LNYREPRTPADAFASINRQRVIDIDEFRLR
jgi:hypothetical protein